MSRPSSQSSVILLVVALLIGWFLGCSRPATWDVVEKGGIVVDEADRKLVDELLEANSLDPGSLAVLDPGKTSAIPPSVGIEAGHVTSLALDQLTVVPTIQGFPKLARLSLSGTFDEVVLEDLPGLQALDLFGTEETLSSVTLGDLPKLQELTIAGGQLGRLNLGHLTSLGSLALERLGLRQPPVVLSTLSNLSLAGNPVEGLGTLAALQDLKRLDLSSTGLDRTDELPSLPKLDHLRLTDNPLPVHLDFPTDRFPALRTLVLQRTPVRTLSAAIVANESLTVRLDDEIQAELSFVTTLEKLRKSYSEATGDLVSGRGATSGSIRDTEGKCQWTTSTLSAARVSCSLRYERLQGTAAARLGQTDPAMPYRGGGEPKVRATLRVAKGRAAIYFRESFDLIQVARHIVEFDPQRAEAFRRPGDRFEGYRRTTASPGAPAVATGSPSLLGDRVLIWLEALDGTAEGLEFIVTPL